MASWYINADTGNDSTGDGSSGSPYLTLSKAHTEASSGDTIVCQDSTASFTFADQTISKDLTITGESDDASGAVFDGGALNVKWYFSADVTITKLTFTNMSCGASWVGAMFYFNTNDVTVDFNLCIIENSTIGGRNGFTSNGIFCTNGTVTGVTFTFERNLIKPTIKSSLASLGFGGSYFNFRTLQTSSISIYNNTIMVGDYAGDERTDKIIETPSASGTDLRVRNNIIYSTQTHATPIDLVLSSANLNSCVFDYNDYYTTGTAFTALPTEAENNIQVDPLFVDLTTDNYDLQQATPCKNAGVII